MINSNQQSPTQQTKAQLFADLPVGCFATAAWFEHRGVSRSSLRYLASVGRLESPAHGVYRTPGAPLKWQYVAASLQRVYGDPESITLVPHIGGMSALLHQGYGQYLQLGSSEAIKLYWPGVIPAWVRKLKLLDGKSFVTRPDSLFYKIRIGHGAGGQYVPWGQIEIDKGAQTPLDSADLAERGLQWHVMGYEDMPLLYAAPERAILEMLFDVPMQESIHHAYAIVQGLTTLRPKRMLALLHDCDSVKVRRLFLALASRCHHPWFDAADWKELNLGSGKRALFPGGKLDPQYQITLPADLDGHAT